MAIQPARGQLDTIVRLTAGFFGVPMAAVSLVESGRVRLLARHGLAEADARRDGFLCAEAIHSRDVVVIPDTAGDERFAASPVVGGPAAVRFYAAMPLIGLAGPAAGPLAIMDTRPHASM